MSQNNSIRWMGFVSAIVVTVSTLTFTIFYILYAAKIPSEWSGMNAYMSGFSQSLYLGWVISCLILALTFPLLLLCICFKVKRQKLIWACAGLLFAAMYGAVLSTNYFELATTFRSAILQHHTESLEWFIIGSPVSITGALEGAGYGFMSLSLLFTGFAFDGAGIDRAIRWILIVNGISGLLGVLLTSLSLTTIAIVSLAVWCITFPIGMILTAIWFVSSNR